MNESANVTRSDRLKQAYLRASRRWFEHQVRGEPIDVAEHLSWADEVVSDGSDPGDLSGHGSDPSELPERTGAEPGDAVPASEAVESVTTTPGAGDA